MRISLPGFPRLLAIFGGLALALRLVTAASAGPVPELPYRTDSVLVAFQKGATLARRLDTIRSLGLTVDPANRSPYFSTLLLGPGAHQQGSTVGQVLAALRQDPTVRIASPNFRVKLLALPNDPLFGQQWSLRNVGQTGGKAGADIGATAAWARTTGKKSVVVAVIDTGVDYTHPDLAYNILRDGNGKVVGYDFVDNDADPMDDYGHGTHVSGILGGRGNNGLGISGVSQVVRIMPVRFIGYNGGETAAAIQSIDFAIAHGAQIMSNSWGGYYPEPLLEEAIARARDKGILFVCAAGNDGVDVAQVPHYPAAYNTRLSNVVSVAATDANDQLPYWTSFGPTVDVAAPGADVLSTIPGAGYGLLSGTSMAAPHVSGAAALLLAANPGLTAEQLRARLTYSAEAIPELAAKVVLGRLNVPRSMEDDIVPPAAPGDVAVTQRAASGLRLAWTAPGDDGSTGSAATYEIAWSTQPITAASFTPSTGPLQVPAPASPGTRQGYLIAGLQPDTDYYVGIRAGDNVHNLSAPVLLGPVHTLTRPGVTLLQDDAEGAGSFRGDGSWGLVPDPDGAATQVYTDSPSGTYANDGSTSLALATPVAILGSAPTLSFRARTDLEYGADTLEVEVSADGGASWRPLKSLTGRTPWTPYRLTLEGYVGQRVLIRFRLQSDESVVRDGVWFDDLRIQTEYVTCIVQDDAEGGGDLEPDAGWRVANDASHSPTHSYGDQLSLQPYSSVDAALALKTGVTLGGIVPQVEFWAMFGQQYGYQRADLEASLDDGKTWRTLFTIPASTVWIHHIIPVGQLAEETPRFRFHLQGYAGFGVDHLWIDDFQVCGDPLLPAGAVDPAPPSDLRATPAGPTAVSLAWKDNSTNEVGFRLERREGTGAYLPIVTTPPDVTTWIDGGLLPATLYTYRVAATTSPLPASYSNEAAVTTPAAPAAPGPPSDLTATPRSETSIRLKWKDNSANESAFELERATADGDFRLIERLPPDTTRFDDPSLQPETLYRYRLRAVNAGGASPPTAEVSAKTKALPQPGEVYVYPALVQFPHTQVGTRRRRSFTVINVGTGTLIGKIVLGANGPVPFRIVQGGGAMRLAPGKVRKVDVEFAPTKKGFAATYVGVINNDPVRPNGYCYLEGLAR